MSTQITTQENAKSFPYLLWYQLIGPKYSVTSFYLTLADVGFRWNDYSSGWTCDIQPTLQVKASDWGPARHRLTNERHLFSRAMFTFRPARGANGRFLAAGQNAIQSHAQTGTEAGFVVYLKDVQILPYPAGYLDPFFDSQTIIFAFQNANCAGNVPRHLRLGPCPYLPV